MRAWTGKTVSRRLRRVLAMALPQYDGLALFLTSVSFVVVAAFDSGIREAVRSMPGGRLPLDVIPLYPLALLFVSGMAFSVVHVFTDRKPSGFEKTAMLYFAVIGNGIAGVIAGAVMWRRFPGWLAVFPLWNLLDAIALMLMYWCDLLDENSVTDEKPCPKAALAGTLAVSILYLACRGFGLHWAMSFSILALFSSNASRELHRVFPPNRSPI